MATLTPWQSRIHKTIIIGQWILLVLAVVAHAATSANTPTFWVAVSLAASYATATTFIPAARYQRRFGTETLTFGGVVLCGIVLALSGGPNSPYLLLSVGPPTLAAFFGGFRVGLMTGTLSSVLLVLITFSQGVDPVDSLVGMALYLAFVLLVGVVRRLLEDIHAEASALAEEKESATKQLETLEQIHGALVKLSEDVSAGRLNAVEVAADTLETILARFPGTAGRLIVINDSGPVVLASRGIPDNQGTTQVIPLATNDSQVGELVLVTPLPLSESDLGHVRMVIHPVSVAFANLQLLQEIVGAAVAEERIRLARDLHDEIGPALASLGLALDLTAMQQAENSDVYSDLAVLRSNVTKLVEDVRASVADLRTAPGPTLTARLMQAVGAYEGDPPVIVDLEERRPPRAAVIADLTAVLVEASRNAHQHSGASRVVITGQVDRNFGRCSVVDDGTGFDAGHEPEGHYGLIGMRERAAKIGATIKFDSKTGTGTVVTVEWGNR
jgi:signal transduction histidine kinase